MSNIDLRRRQLFAGIAASALPTGAVAQGGHGAPEAKDGQSSKGEEFAKLPLAEKWRRRHPQPVLVSDLIGRKVLDRDQGVLGFIDDIVATPAGEVHIAFHRRRLFAFRGERVVVPNILAALLGPFVMLNEASAEDVAKLPTYVPARFMAVDRGSRIQMALTRH